MDKNKLFETVEAKADVLTALSDKIWEYAELSMMEYRSTAAYLQVLKDEGFTVTEKLFNFNIKSIGNIGTESDIRLSLSVFPL